MTVANEVAEAAALRDLAFAKAFAAAGAIATDALRL